MATPPQAIKTSANPWLVVRRIEQVMKSAGKAGASHTGEVRPPR